MHKIAQKVTSVALAASMLLSMFAVNTVAFADEFKDNTTVSDEVTEAPVSDDEVDTVESVDKTEMCIRDRPYPHRSIRYQVPPNP